MYTLNTINDSYVHNDDKNAEMLLFTTFLASWLPVSRHDGSLSWLRYQSHILIISGPVSSICYFQDFAEFRTRSLPILGSRS